MSSEDPSAPASSPGTLDYARSDVGTKREPRVVGRMLLKVSNAFAVVLLLLALWRVHQPGISGGITCLALPLGFIAGALWIVGFGMSVRKPSKEGPWAVYNVKWLLVPAVLAIAAGGTAKTLVGPRIAFEISRSSFEAAVQNPPSTSALPTRIALYPVEDIRTDDNGGTWFSTAHYDRFMFRRDYVGFVHNPARGAGPFGDTSAPPRLRSLGGGWYIFWDYVD